MRRRVRREYTWSGGAWLETNEVRYVCDAMLAVQERDANNLPVVTYTRGNDLSGSLQNAGGIGGLLARTDNGRMSAGEPAAHAFYSFDGNGNVTGMVDINGRVVAWYEYDPFGNTLSINGTLAEANGYRFSSKECHFNSGLYYYGFRFYSPVLQRWLTRDPIEEFFQINLYGFVRGAVIGTVDFFGLSDADFCRIYSTALDTVDRLNRDRLRLKNHPYLNNILSSLGCGYYGCVDQANEAFKDLLKEEKRQKFDDKWDFVHHYGTSFIFPHNWIEAVPQNHSYPKIIIDPWKGSITPISQETPVPIISPLTVNKNSVPALSIPIDTLCH